MSTEIRMNPELKAQSERYSQAIIAQADKYKRSADHNLNQGRPWRAKRWYNKAKLGYELAKYAAHKSNLPDLENAMEQKLDEIRKLIK